jgi:hypothetical protein
MATARAFHATNPMLKPFERAARIYCDKAGMDPDLKVRMPHPALEGVHLEIAQWETVAERLLDVSLMLTSLKEASAQLPQGANDA